jgi:hypothetical protein
LNIAIIEIIDYDDFTNSAINEKLTQSNIAINEKLVYDDLLIWLEFIKLDPRLDKLSISSIMTEIDGIA